MSLEGLAVRGARPVVLDILVPQWTHVLPEGNPALDGPAFADHGEAMSWYGTEHTNLVTATRLVAEHRLHDITCHSQPSAITRSARTGWSGSARTRLHDEALHALQESLLDRAGEVNLATQTPTQRETAPLPAARSLLGMRATNGYLRQGVPRRW